MNLKLAALAATVALITGCGSTPYQCPLNDSPSGKCASTADAYKAARAVPKDPRGMVTVFDKSAAGPAKEKNAQPYVGAQASDYPAAGANGMPVFEQPKVFRPWLAPYVDAEGNLRSGEYGYFSTPGRWNYGTLRQAGNAASMQGPARPDNLGFNPVKATVATKAGPAKPAEGKTTANGPTPTSQPASAPAETKVGDITQPYQRITD